MDHDSCDSFLFDFEQNLIPFCSKSKGKLSQRSHSIQLETILPNEVRVREFLLDIKTYGNIYMWKGALHKIRFQF